MIVNHFYLHDHEVGAIEKNKADLIVTSIDQLLKLDDSELRKDFPLVVYQTGSGTQTNMNVNEVVSHVAQNINLQLEILPNDDVNHGQSSNDIFPTAMNITAAMAVEKLIDSLKHLIEELPHETVECVLNDEDAVCKICGSDLKVIGKKKVRSEIQYIPAKLVVKDYVQYVYKCVDCGKNDINPYDSIYCAPVQAPVLAHSVASPSIVAWIMYQKYMMSVPLYRQECRLQSYFHL